MIRMASLAVVLVLAACQASREPIPPQALPEPEPARGGAQVSDQEAAAIGTLAEWLSQQAKTNNTAAIGELMGTTAPEQIKDMVARIQQVDMAKTYRQHLVDDGRKAPGDKRLDYHDPAHFQVDLSKRGGSWAVTRLWFCR